MLIITRLDIDDAYVLIAGARVKAQEIGVPMCIAITDESGNLIAFERMDGDKITSITLAIDKSFTATGIPKGTHALGQVNQSGQPAHGISSTLGGEWLWWPASFPCFRAGKSSAGSVSAPDRRHRILQLPKLASSHSPNT